MEQLSLYRHCPLSMFRKTVLLGKGRGEVGAAVASIAVATDDAHLLAEPHNFRPHRLAEHDAAAIEVRDGNGLGGLRGRVAEEAIASELDR